MDEYDSEHLSYAMEPPSKRRRVESNGFETVSSSLEPTLPYENYSTVFRGSQQLLGYQSISRTVANAPDQPNIWACSEETALPSGSSKDLVISLQPEINNTREWKIDSGFPSKEMTMTLVEDGRDLGNTLMCFGMVCCMFLDQASQLTFVQIVFSNLKATNLCLLDATTGRIPVGIDGQLVSSSGRGARNNESDICVLRSSRDAQIIMELKSHPDITLQCYVNVHRKFFRSNRKAAKSQSQCRLYVIVYGHSYMFEQIGNFFEEADMYLQDPLCPDADVPYKNPHLLSQPEELLMTSSFVPQHEFEHFSTPADVVDSLLRSEDLPLAPTPQALKTPLQRYAGW